MLSEGGRQPSIAAIDDILGAAEPSKLAMRARKFDEVFNGQMVPLIGLHAANIGGYIITRHLSRTYSLSALFIVSAVIVAALALRGAHTKSQTASPGVAGAVTVLVCLGCISAPLALLETIVAMCAALLVLELLVFGGWISTGQLVSAPVYIGFFVSFMSGPQVEGSAFLYVIPTLVGLAVVWRLGAFYRGVGLLVGAIAVLASYTSEHSHWLLIALGAVLLIAVSVYEVFVPRTRASNFHEFLLDFMAPAVMSLVAYGLFPSGHFFLYVLPVYAIYAAAFWFRRRPHRLGTRAVWLAAIACGAVLQVTEQLDDRSNTALNLLISVAVVFAGNAEKNRFVRNAGCLFLLAVSLFFVKDLVVRVSWASGGALPGVYDWGLFAAIFAAGVYGTLKSSFDKPVPWWRGLVHPRHACLTRKLFRSLRSRALQIPLIGPGLGLAGTLLGLVRYLKAEGKSVELPDIAMIAQGVFCAVGVGKLLDFALHGPALANLAAEFGLTPADLTEMLSWLFWGSAFYVMGLFRRQVLNVFTGVFFVLVPLVQFVATNPGAFEKSSLAVFGFATGIILLILGLLRRVVGGKPLRGVPASQAPALRLPELSPGGEAESASL